MRREPGDPADAPVVSTPDVPFDLRLLWSFAAVAEELHFSRAAERLMIAQPALSRQIAKLEEQLGTRLLERSSRDVALTTAGQALLKATGDILRSAERAARAVAAEQDELTVYVAAEVDPRLTHLVARFVAAHPAIAVHVHGSPGSGTASVTGGAVDAAIDLLEDLTPALAYLPCVRVPVGIACPAAHRLAAQESVAWTDLDGERVMVAPETLSTGYNRWVRDHLQAAGVRVQEVEGPRVTGSMLGSFVAGGDFGLHVCPRYAHDPAPPGLVWRPFRPTVRFEFGVAWRRDDTRPALQRFVRWMGAQR